MREVLGGGHYALKPRPPRGASFSRGLLCRGKDVAGPMSEGGVFEDGISRVDGESKCSWRV